MEKVTQGSVHFELLAARPQDVRLVAAWLFSEWGDPAKGHSVEQLAEKLRSKISLAALPMHLLAIQQGTPVGFVALKLFEMGSYPEREHWLGSLFVPSAERGYGIGSALIEEVIRRAQNHRVSKLSLQTENLSGGLYLKHGWKPVEQIESDGDQVLVMERDIISTQPPPETLSFGEVTLRFAKVVPGEPSRGFVPFFHFRILATDGADVGHINFRVGDSEHVRVCAGHVGFEIAEGFRGRGYASQACRALAPFIRSVCGVVTITCDPDNLASRRTIERVGAQFIDEVAVPTNDPHYQRGSRTKRRYRWTP